MPVANDGSAYFKGTTPIIRLYAAGEEIWPKILPIELTITSNRWDLQLVRWNNVGTVDNYIVYKDGIEVYRGQLLLYPATGLMPSTSYTWRVDAVRNNLVRTTATQAFSTAPRTAPTMTTSSPGWDTNSISWTDSTAGSIDSYVLKEGSTVIPGSGNSRTHSGLMPSSAHNYTLESYRDGTLIPPNRTASRTTAAHGALGVTHSQLAWNYVLLSWTDTDQRSIDKYSVYQNDNVWIEDSTSPSDKSSGIGLSASTNYSFTVRAYRGGVEIPSRESESFSSPARPISYGTAYSNVGWENFTGWTSSSQRVLGGPNIGVGVGGTFTNMVALVYGRGGVAFRGEPRINGVAGPQQVYTVGRSHTNWPFSLGFAAGTFTTAVVVGGSNWGSAEWSPWTGQRWDYYCQVNQLDYQYYAAAAERIEEMRRLPWHREEFEGQDGLHTETWSDATGAAIIQARVTDIATSEVLVDWTGEFLLEGAGTVEGEEPSAP